MFWFVPTANANTFMPPAASEVAQQVSHLYAFMLIASVISFAILIRADGECQIVPALDKIFNLLIFEILQHEMLKSSIPQLLNFITQPPRCRNYPHLGIIIGKAVNIRHHLIPQCWIEYLVDAIE